MLASILFVGCTNTANPGVGKSDTNVISTPVQTQINTAEPAQSPVNKDVPAKNAGNINDIIHAKLQLLSPLFVNYNDDLIVGDYKKLATDTLALRKEVKAQQDYFGETPSKSLIENINSISSPEKIAYQKQVGYLKTLNDLIVQTEDSLVYVNDDNSELTAKDKLKIFEPVIERREIAYYQVKTLLETCDEYGNSCGSDDEIIQNLKKNPF